MMNKNCVNQLKTKQSHLERERKQVLQHLALLDRKITSVTESIEIMQQKQEIISSYNTPNFTYRTYKKKFKCRIGKTVLYFLKKNPDHYFSVSELARIILDYDNQADVKVTDEHCKSIRQSLGQFHLKGLVERKILSLSSRDIRWKLITK